jgi:putative nucleotidyltransferase-like protein
MTQSVTDRASCELSERSHAFYRRMMEALLSAEAPFLVGGAYAFACYTGIERFTKDFDIFIKRADLDRVEGVLAQAGCEIQRFAPHWLSKAISGADFIDLIWSSGNGIAVVDDVWFEKATRGEVLGTKVALIPAEEMIWSKALIMERERYDGADVAHLVHEQAHRLDWQRLLERFGPNWRVLLVHLTLFGFIYPQRRASIPDWLMAELTRRLRVEQRQQPPRAAVCLGPLLSRNQYAVDVERRGYRDGRLPPNGNMSQREIDIWEQRRRVDQGDCPTA